MYLFGASGHGKVVAEIIESLNLCIDGFIDTDLDKISLLGYRVFHEYPDGPLEVVIAIGNNEVRKRIANQYSCIFPKLISNSANLSHRSVLGKGTVVMAGATINVDVNIGQHCIINTNASVDHDCIIEDFVHLSPNVALAGNVFVGEGTHVGIGACVIQGVKIGRWCTIGAGAVIIRDIPDGCTVVGNPGKIIRKIEHKL
ncbi:acetyltransferase [Sphingobacterium sp. GVS05A]|uniref:acetyltransferase n=1 Tax=Sphingobacterium sp. GVS05A TaxID=2862679 RepID=UPI001CBBCA48|nr:acetyltransferase [Sphingobacterium sp. GVS05A]